MEHCDSFPDTRKKAISMGSKYYFTGKPCKHGHVSKRLVSWGCDECLRANNTSEKQKAQTLRYYHENKESRNEYSRQYRRENRARIADYRHQYEKINRQRITDRHRDYYRTAKGKAISFIYRSLRRTLILEAKNGKAQHVLGYTSDELMRHVESQFKTGMTWKNHGTAWHIDHVTPIKHYLSRGINDPKIVNALSNLQPLFKDDNLRKGDRLNWGASHGAL